ncbi:MAG TPA: TRAP transporter substrate-binding protein DctP [Anaeromyxobacteraceae bacterium]|nr:TRAP transporter substrate-binding protein DctP [Anaeromyxobacteraceae bacterium]
MTPPSLAPRAALAAALLCLGPDARGQELNVKLGTLAPAGSNWHEILKDMAERWSQASQGKVKLRIYPGGTQGSESEMIRKMAVGQLQAAAVTTVGLGDIVREPQGLAVPLMFDAEDELAAVMQKVQPKLESFLERKGYVALTWGVIGPIKIFCSRPYRTPAEAASAKIFVWEGDPGSVEAMRAAGFNPVVLSSTDVITSLQTGMIDCVPNVALYALPVRLFERASHMIDVNWGFLVGATVIRKDVWGRIPAEVRPKLQEISRELGKKVDAEVGKLNSDAVVAMKKQGLDVIEVNQGLWRAAAEKAWPVVRGKIVPTEFFDEVKRERDAYRASKKKP